MQRHLVVTVGARVSQQMPAALAPEGALVDRQYRLVSGIDTLRGPARARDSKPRVSRAPTEPARPTLSMAKSAVPCRRSRPPRLGMRGPTPISGRRRGRSTPLPVSSWPGRPRSSRSGRARSTRLASMRPQRPAVRDDEHRPVRMQPRGSARARPCTRSATSSVVSPSPHCPRTASGKPLGDLDVRQPFPGAEVLLAQARVDGRPRARARRRPRSRCRAPATGRSRRRRPAARSASCSASARACSTPAALSGMSVCPWTRRPRFQSVSPCRASRISVIRQPYRGRLTLARADRAGHRAPPARRRRPRRRRAGDRRRGQPGARRGAVRDVGHLADASARVPIARASTTRRSTSPTATHPPIVRISAFEGRPPELVARVLSAVAGIVVRELGLAARQRVRRLGRAPRRTRAHGRRHARHVGLGSAWISGSPARSRSSPARAGGSAAGSRRGSPTRARTSSSAPVAATSSTPRCGRSTGPGRAIGVVADVTTADGAAAVVEAAVEQLGGVDIVVNNVGGSGAKTFADMDAADLQAVLDKNLFPAVNVSRAALPVLRARGGGVIAMISSIWGREGGGAPELQRRQGGRDQPRQGDGDRPREGRRSACSASRPARRCSRAAAGSAALRDDPEGMAAFIERELPFGRLGTVDEIADVVTFLVSPRASWVVGTCVTVDGGQSRSF